MCVKAVRVRFEVYFITTIGEISALVAHHCQLEVTLNVVHINGTHLFGINFVLKK